MKGLLDDSFTRYRMFQTAQLLTPFRGMSSRRAKRATELKAKEST